MGDGVSRRSFVTSAAVGAATALFSGRVHGANDRIRLGFIGVGNRGGQLIDATLRHPDAEIAAICDVYAPHLEKAAAKLPNRVEPYRDFRQVLERKDLDAVVIGTPDHWHAIQTVDACDAGKDVYVEKPLSITIFEGRRMVEAARRNQRIVQVGTQRRSGTMYADLARKVRDGLIGKVTVARCYRHENMWPNGMGKAPDGNPPEGLDWDLWLGPRPMRAFRSTIAPYKFRWWNEYSSQIANWGVHFIDAIRWMMNTEAPSSVVALGGRYAVDDDRNIPDTLEAVFEAPEGGLIIFGQYEANGANPMKRGYLELRGTNGTLFVDDGGWDVEPEQGGQFQEKKPRMEALKGQSADGDLTTQHMRNFLDCVKSRKTPTADVETGHRSTTFSLLGVISLVAKSRLDWDAQKERIVNNEDANKFLHYDYRAPWKLA